MTKIYLAGPMTGLPDYNYPAFREAAEKLRERGWKVLSPAENYNGDTSLPRYMYMRKNIKLLLKAEGIVLLPGWQDSEGAKLEFDIACALDLDIYELSTLLQPKFITKGFVEWQG